MIGKKMFSPLLVLMTTWALASWHDASALVFYTADDLGSGLFRYNLKLDNRMGTEPLSGLNLLFGNSVFGLDGASKVGVPNADWDFLLPDPVGGIDDLDFISLLPAADVAIGQQLAGFSFISMRAPTALVAGEFAVEAIGSDSAQQIPIGDAIAAPEPATLMLIMLALVLAWPATVRPWRQSDRCDVSRKTLAAG